MSELKAGEKAVSIGDLARECGVTTRTLRYWEEMGLIESLQRTDGAAREYNPYDLGRIRFILKLKELGLTIREMQDISQALFLDAAGAARMLPRLVELLERQIDKLDERMAHLSSLKREIGQYRGKMAGRLTAIAGDRGGSAGTGRKT